MTIRQTYEAKARSGAIEKDPAQLQVIDILDALRDELEAYVPARKSAALGWLFGSKRDSTPPKGLYIWGGVGRGKSMLMDLFYEQADVAKKRRVHFHAFMGEVHAAIFRHRQALKRGTATGEDPIEPVAEGIANRASLLCFDEFSITDIADAMILGRLFKVLFARGVVIVATSNVEPSMLYKDGLNRALFLPSIAMLEEHMDVFHLESRSDYRMEKLAGAECFHVPADEKARAELDGIFTTLTGATSGQPATLKVLGRTIAVPQARGKVARFSFDDLCGKPLGAQDYLAIARRYESVILDAIPILSASQRNEAKRFIILIDTFYEARVKLFASAAALPGELFEAADGDEAFEFRRTVSRLNEMRSKDYMVLPHVGGEADDSAIVDT